MKKYKLRCFGCGDTFPNKTFVFRNKTIPYCFECYCESLCDPQDFPCPTHEDDEKMVEQHLKYIGEY